MIDAEKLKPILDGYKESFSEHWPKENFKWKALKYFQDHWDIEAPNFGDMFEEATSKTRPLLEDQNVKARKQIISFAKMNDDATRQMFRDLLNEDTSLIERVEQFISKSKEMQEECDDPTLRNRDYQDHNAITTYLWLCYPDKYYIYKYTYFKAASKELGLATHITRGAIKNVTDCFKLYDDICSVIQKDDEICNLISKSLTDDCWPDKKMHTTAIDILVYITKYYSKEEYSDSDDADNSSKDENEGNLDNQILTGTGMTEEDVHQKKNFKDWMKSQISNTGESFKPSTIGSYTRTMEAGYKRFKPYKNYSNIYQIRQTQELKEYIEYLENEPEFPQFNKDNDTHACKLGLENYLQFLEEQKFHTGYEPESESKYKRNWIVFGAPGTGKSYHINQKKDDLLGKDSMDNYERVTFHPDYSYANFVGTYKPVPCKANDENDSVTYKYVPGPFMRVLVKALENARTENPKPFLLIIEEINRADMAAVFGDVFQLLDRGDNNVSEYPIEASEDMKEYLAEQLKVDPNEYSKICIPDNMFIWATMNSADQGVFPMDTAFKRRWDFTYRGIDESEDDLIGKYVELGEGADKQRIEWNNLRKAINKFLSDNGINEDKQLGPYFIARKIVVPEDGDVIKSEDFISAFKDKVLMYLFEDAARQRRSELFSGPSSRYSEICEDFKKKGIKIFCQEIVNEYENMPVKRSDAGD